jgi:hypothetical protein
MFFMKGRKKTKYATHFAGLTAVQQLNARLQLKWLMSYYNDAEEENRDISGALSFWGTKF